MPVDPMTKRKSVSCIFNFFGISIFINVEITGPARLFAKVLLSVVLASACEALAK